MEILNELQLTSIHIMNILTDAVISYFFVFIVFVAFFPHVCSLLVYNMLSLCSVVFNSNALT